MDEIVSALDKGEKRRRGANKMCHPADAQTLGAFYYLLMKNRRERKER